MGTTRTTAADRMHRQENPWQGVARRRIPAGYLALCAASIVTALALVLTFQAKRIAAATDRGEVTNLSALTGPEELDRVLAPVFPRAADRRAAASAIHRFLMDEGGHAPEAPNVGALARIRVPAADGGPDLTVPLLSRRQLASLQPSILVRTPEVFGRSFWRALAIYLFSFHALAAYLALHRVRGDPWLLPAAHLLTGLGFAAMVALQDPLRDRLLFAGFAVGVSLGCAAFALCASLAIQRSALARLSLAPLSAAVLLSLLLILFGSGPGTSGAKVNLLGMQPVEAIRLLLVLFLAGYFATRWEFIRELRETQFGGLRIPARFRVPRYDHVLPVLVGVALALVLFFLQKDLGPALVLGCLFLALYGVARREAVLVLVGLALMLSGVAAGYLAGYPRTIVTRVAMWQSPWENGMPGGDHVAHALWAFASGGAIGTGLGLGEPGIVPEAHTDMVLAALGEELGFAGVLVVALLYGVLLHRGFAIALRARTDYGVFLALGLTLSLALPLLLIAGGALGLFPLSGVATPFVSYGKSSMIASFATLGLLFALARENAGGEPATEPFRGPVRVAAITLAVLALAILGRAAMVQVVSADETMTASALTPQADGVLRYQDNPRLRLASQLLPRGRVLDRRGVPLAVSRCSELEGHRQVLQQLGATAPCDDRVSRHYPLGGHTYHLLGDASTRLHWAASNTSYEERDRDAHLRGFDDGATAMEHEDPRTGERVRAVKRDYSEIVTLWRHRHRLSHPDVRRLMARPRDLRLTIDARLQVRAARALDRHLASGGHSLGAVVVMDASTGEVLALVNAPRPSITDAVRADGIALPPPDDPAWFDRARYGLYPPGSTFKLVTAAAALRKDPSLGTVTFICRRLPDGRMGNHVRGWSRPVRDDHLNTVAHGEVNLQTGLEKSCNAYFAQLAMRVGPAALHDTAKLFEIAVAHPDTPERLAASLPHAGYGQGEVRLTPFKMARVAAAIANAGRMPYGRWAAAEDDPRRRDAITVLTPEAANQIGAYMRGVVLRGTGRSLATVSPAVAGKTGTAEVDGAASHAWFAGFAPHGATSGRRVAFAVLIENGGYGGRTAAAVARDVVSAVRDLGLLERSR